MNKKAIGLMLLPGICFLLVSNMLLAQAAPKPKYEEGVHYKVIENAPVRSGDKVEVAEAFSYMCPHCGSFEPFISNWLKRKPENVVFKRIPVVFGHGSWEMYARAYVTAELMGIADASHTALMDKLWKAREVPRSIEELAAFYSAYGVDPEKFVATSKSFAVDAILRKGQREVQADGVQGTPSLIVNGKYLVAGNEALASYDVMLDVVDYLVSLESAEHKAAAGAQAAAAAETIPADGGSN